jgi:hypothetical protein
MCNTHGPRRKFTRWSLAVRNNSFLSPGKPPPLGKIVKAPAQKRTGPSTRAKPRPPLDPSGLRLEWCGRTHDNLRTNRMHSQSTYFGPRVWLLPFRFLSPLLVSKRRCQHVLHQEASTQIGRALPTDEIRKRWPAQGKALCKKKDPAEARNASVCPTTTRSGAKSRRMLCLTEKVTIRSSQDDRLEESTVRILGRNAERDRTYIPGKTMCACAQMSYHLVSSAPTSAPGMYEKNSTRKVKATVAITKGPQGQSGCHPALTLFTLSVVIPGSQSTYTAARACSRSHTQRGFRASWPHLVSLVFADHRQALRLFHAAEYQLNDVQCAPGACPAPRQCAASYRCASPRSTATYTAGMSCKAQRAPGHGTGLHGRKGARASWYPNT